MKTRQLHVWIVLVTGAACASDYSDPAPVDPPAVAGDAAIDVAGKRLSRSRKPHQHYDINHVLGTGQSSSLGTEGTPALSTTPTPDALMFHGGLVPGSDLASFVPLVERYVETPSSGFVGDLASPTHEMLVSLHGVNGAAYSNLKKGTVPYANGMAQVAAAKALAAAEGKSYIVRAITNVHGETDASQGNTHYAADLTEWQHDYETDIGYPVPMLISQPYLVGSWPIAVQQLAASVASDGRIVLVGPKYYLPRGATSHLTNEGYRHMGEDYAKAYRRVVLEGKRWEPLRPIEVTRAGAVVTVRFAVPAPPLVVDTLLVRATANDGFEYIGAAISSVALASPDTISVTLATPAPGRLRYAATAGRGNLRDSDATPSRYGYALYNWCVHFDEAVP